MEPNVILLAAAAVGLALPAALLSRLRGLRQFKTTKAGLSKRALEDSAALLGLIGECQASRRAVAGEYD